MEMKKYRLGEICYLNKSSLKSNDAISVILYLDTSSITENIISGLQTFSIKDAPSRAQRKVKKNTIIFSTVRPNQKHYGIIHNPQNNLIVSSGFTTLDVKNQNEFDPEFVYLTLTQPVIVNYLHTLAQNSVSSYPSINPDDIGNLYLSFPCFDTQRKIAAILSALDNKIALNRRINAKLEQMAKRLYDYWFVQFDFPNAEGKPYKSSGGKMVYNATLKREIPEGWKVKLLGDAISINRGKTITEKKAIKGNVKVVAAGLSFSYYHNQSNRDVNCITISGSGENAGFVNFWREPIYASDCSTIQFDNIVDTILCYHTLKMQEKRFYQISHKSAQPHIQPSDIAQIPMVFPDEIVKEKVSILFAHYNTLIGKNQKEIERLTALRDKLLPLLMNGQVTVK